MTPVQPRITKPTAIDYKSKRPYFGWLPLERVKQTFEQCTQHMRLPPSTHLQKQFRSPNPGANIFHCPEANATDMIYSDTPAIDGGETLAHIFAGLISRVTDVFKAKNGSAECFLGAFQDRVCMHGAPNKLIADNTPMYHSWRIIRYMRNIWCPLWQCEAKHQHQNYAENRYKLVKRMTNCMMDRFNVPAYGWFLCMCWACFLLNHSVEASVVSGLLTPLMMSNFEMTDISPLLVFSFWQPVYVLKNEKEPTFPSKSTKVCGRFVRISEHIGHAMTFQILLDDTKNIVHSSLVCSALDPDLLNLHLEPDHPGDLHPTVQAELLLNKENKQRDHFLANVRNKRQEQELLDRVHVRLDQDLSRNDSKPALSIDNDDFDNDTSPTFVFLRDDGEFENSSVHRDKRKKLVNPFKMDPNDLHSTEKPTWKEFKVPLLYIITSNLFYNLAT